MVRVRAAIAAAALLACAVFAGAGCSTTVSGHGSLLPAASGTPSTGGVVPSVGPPPSARPAPGSSATPGAAPPPAACPAGTCRQSMSTTLSAPFAIVVRTNPAYANGTGAAIVELTESGVAVAWYVLPSQSPSEISCSSTPSQSNCVLVDHVGAHGSTAIVFRLAGHALSRGSTVVASTPDMHARDLNGDGWIDAAGLQNNGVPNNATGKVYWQTWASDGVQLRSSGCSPPAATAPPAPAVLLHGSCP